MEDFSNMASRYLQQSIIQHCGNQSCFWTIIRYISIYLYKHNCAVSLSSSKFSFQHLFSFFFLVLPHHISIFTSCLLSFAPSCFSDLPSLYLFCLLFFFLLLLLPSLCCSASIASTLTSHLHYTATSCLFPLLTSSVFSSSFVIHKHHFCCLSFSLYFSSAFFGYFIIASCSYFFSFIPLYL